mmetsp:Transcript_12071/g.23030  ORF Transcript_12071/g.23030 Transcript_12071/m.23030 type:complete len:569 (-) Transcript_12071:372-2078(-)
MERLVTAFGEGNINADWMMYTGSAEESGELWFSPDNLGAEQHHPLQGGLPYLLLPVAAGLGACGYVAKVFAHRRLVARGQLGFGREWAEDDLSLCSSSCASKLAGSGLTADDTMSYLSAKTALSLAESYEELATLLATYHLDNSHRLVSVASTASLASLMPSCSSSSSLSACSTRSWGSHTAALASDCGADLLSPTEAALGSQGKGARGFGQTGKKTTPHTHGDKSQPQSQLSPNQFSSTRLHILGKLVSGEVVTAAGELNLTRVRCRFSWYRVEASATGRLRKVKPVRIAGAHAPIYRISAADVGSRLRVVARVLGPDGSYSSASISALSGFVAASPRGARAASREKGLAPAGAPSAARPCPAPAAAAATPAPTVAAAGDEARADAACKSVVNHDSASPSLSVPSPSSTKSTTPRSSCDGTLETGDPLALHSLIINGVPQCGTKLLAKGKSHDSKLKCRFQWTRLLQDKEGNLIKQRLKGVSTPWYTPVAEDVGCWLRVKAAPVLADGQLGHSTFATTATKVKEAPACPNGTTTADIHKLGESTVSFGFPASDPIPESLSPILDSTM